MLQNCNFPCETRKIIIIFQVVDCRSTDATITIDLSPCNFQDVSHKLVSRYIGHNSPSVVYLFLLFVFCLHSLASVCFSFVWFTLKYVRAWDIQNSLKQCILDAVRNHTQYQCAIFLIFFVPFSPFNYDVLCYYTRYGFSAPDSSYHYNSAVTS